MTISVNMILTGYWTCFWEITLENWNTFGVGGAWIYDRISYILIRYHIHIYLPCLYMSGTRKQENLRTRFVEPKGYNLWRPQKDYLAGSRLFLWSHETGILWNPDFSSETKCSCWTQFMKIILLVLSLVRISLISKHLPRPGWRQEFWYNCSIETEVVFK